MTPAEYELAACRLGDAELFDDVDSARDGARTRIETAQRVCRRCPVAALCLSEAQAAGDSGVRGGLLLDGGVERDLPSGRGYRVRQAPQHRPAVQQPRQRGLRRQPIDDLSVEAIMAGTLRIAAGTESVDLLEAVRRLAALGRDDETIGARIGRKTGAVCKLRLRHGIPAGAHHNSRRKKVA